MNGQRRATRPALESLVIATLGLFALRVGIRPISDNSMFLHLRTGIDIATTGHVPHTDPYSFTALHHSWIVESWFAEFLYGIAYRVGGMHLVVLEQALIMVVLALVVGSIARAGSTLRTLVSAGTCVFAGVALWSQRPLLFGLLGLALVILVVERRWSAWWLIPVVWMWVNTHGSFPFGLLWLGAVYVGTAIEERRRPKELEPYVGVFVLGLIVAMINPVGPKLVAFPLTVEAKHNVFANIVEWRSPNFQSAGPLFALVFFTIALLILVRRGALWRDVFPVVGFLALGLISVRNMAPAAIVLAPALGRAMHARLKTAVSASGGEEAEPASSEPDADPDDADPDDAAAREAAPTRPPAPVTALAIALVVATVVFVAGSFSTAALNFKLYPTGAEHYLATHGLLDGQHIATQDYVGDYRELVEGVGPSKVFIDDRYDMYPASVSGDYQLLLNARSSALTVLDKWHITVVMWQRNGGLPDELHLAGGWRTVYSDKNWDVLVRDLSVRAAPPT